jgi:hypothetical protein
MYYVLCIVRHYSISGIHMLACESIEAEEGAQVTSESRRDRK